MSLPGALSNLAIAPALMGTLGNDGSLQRLTALAFAWDRKQEICVASGPLLLSSMVCCYSAALPGISGGWSCMIQRLILLSISILFFPLKSSTEDIQILRERGREGEREGEKHPGEKETLIGCLLSAPQPGTEPTTQAYALTGNWIQGLVVYGMTFQPTEPPGQGSISILVTRVY